MSPARVVAQNPRASGAVIRRDRILLAAAGCIAVVAVVLDHLLRDDLGVATPWPRLAAALFAVLGGSAITLASWDRSSRDAVRRGPMRQLTVASGVLWFGLAAGYLVTAWAPGEMDPRIEVIPLLLGLTIAASPLMKIAWPRSMTAPDARVAVSDSLIAVTALAVIWWQVVVPLWVYAPGYLVWERVDQTVTFTALAMAVLVVVVSRRIGTLPLVQIGLLLGGVVIHLVSDTVSQLMTGGDERTGVAYSVLGFTVAASLVVAFAHRRPVEVESDATRRNREWMSAGLPVVLAFPAGLLVIRMAVSSLTPSVSAVMWWVVVPLWVLFLSSLLAARLAVTYELRQMQQGAVAMLLAERTREGWFRALVGDSGEYVFVLDPLGRIVYASPRVERDIALHERPQRFDPSHKHNLSDVLVGTSAAQVRLLLAQVALDTSMAGPHEMSIAGHDGVIVEVAALIRAITDVEFQGFVVTARDVSDARRLQRQLDTSHDRDSLTGLESRDSFLTTAQAALDDHELGERVAVLVLDVERFGALNDSVGRDTGDEILVALARTFDRLPGEVRAAARLHGDSFAWLLVSSDPERAVGETVEQSRLDVRGLLLADGREIELSFRAGYVIADEGSTTAADWCLEAADLALARSRASRHALLVEYHADMRAETERRVAGERRLRWAIAEDRLEMFYQPIVRLADSSVRGSESLMRLRDSDGRIIPPLDFIPLAEEIGLAGEIGRIALRKACQQTVHASEAVGRPLYVSVNVSADQLTPALVREVAETLRSSGLDAEQLTLEITESMLADQSPRTQQVLRDLRALGVSISLDDFGTGYSSMSYLATLPVDGLKIDRSFVMTLGSSAEGLTLARIVVQLAAALDLRTVAEGIETMEQADLLRGMGCDYGQGYLFARPMPFHDYIDALRAGLGALDELAP